MTPRLVHLIYIHGFRGDETTFQAFPTHLQQYLTSIIPLGLNIQIQSSLYPTYKSVKPISNATKNFLEWLNTQPPGPVILLGHSMGGLLAAEAATDPSNNPDGHPGAKPHRIVGMIAFDCPYLGMHPHVVLSGIASLFAKKEEEQPTLKKESELNRHSSVKLVNGRVTDDWDNFKNIQANSSRASLTSQQSESYLSVHSRSPSSSSLLSPSDSSLSTRSRSPSPTVQLYDRTMNFVSEHSNDPFVRWFRKHSDEPFTASKQWVVDHFQFGICMFDPAGLKKRYTHLVAWNGLWVNYWTITVPKAKDAKTNSQSDLPRVDSDPHSQGRSISDSLHRRHMVAENDVAFESGDGAVLRYAHSATESSANSLLSASSLASSFSEMEISKPGQETDTKTAEKERRRLEKEHEKQLKKLKKEREAEAKAAAKEEKKKVGRHFIVLPTGLGAALGGGDKWEKVAIGGVEDEVAAHTGLFISGQNLDYEGLVQRVGAKVLEWCEKI